MRASWQTLDTSRCSAHARTAARPDHQHQRRRSTSSRSSMEELIRVTSYRSPLLDRPGAVAAEGVDSGVAAHYGDPFREQKALAAGDGFVDLSHRGVIAVTGPDRLTWLHSLTTQDLESLAPNSWTMTLVLSPQGHVEHALTGYDDGETFWAYTEPGAAEAAV